ncbi:flavodoxin [Lawsonibacter faecis]|uniref:Flavodoxin n=1 Tax=Lawsonibacter faecis TaxID=2763052 RepID=A0A8J6MC36_9FIRM|nr:MULTISPECIES: flavodoxin [Oscillospiraceae]MTQ97168.1 flavodoxin [Pseudoflavonifractor sp. BIOML-A16]MTR05933.1 flavodoxin [Pseudoflavonifractor sp. BIOML-A15]MTR32564.1 flavodoxin [Pseudoflavonifractor sp. BIOML-A14]MTR72975.1 flavodoxin [Pseudoflavonifractor sp. BIOML-A18]MTS63802.1 flavodoxin [Pseudoflavonifractor sp. BIOML-A5]MTS71420.1 flavodoxin [Pseudoflavonifractor sp. BIOML-A8]MTS91072.1 flavodoxin [Pseudoflavonifractor sp. BIOML-A4]
MNILIAYFSYTGHTKGIARQIQALTGGDLFEIRPAIPYPQDYDTAERQGRRETRDGYHPPLAEPSPDLSGYDALLLGTPNWFNTAAPPVATFLAENDFGGKPIALFCTNGGGGLGHIPADVKALRRDAKLLDSLNLYEDGGAGAKAKIADWLKKNGLM